MAKIRRPFRFSKIIPAASIFLTALAVLAALTFLSGGSDVYAALAGYGTESYAMVGQTTLKTTYRDGTGRIEGNRGLDGGTAVDADDFSFVGDLVQFGSANASNQVAFGADGMAVSYTRTDDELSDKFYLSSRKTIAAGSTLDKALRERKYEVTARITASVEVRSANTEVRTRYVWNSGTGTPVTGSFVGASVDFETRVLSAEGANPNFSVEFYFPRNEADAGRNKTVDVTISRVSVRFIARLADGINGASLKANVEGANRTPIEISSGESGVRYVKPTDKVTLDLTLTKDGAPYELGDAYREIFAPTSTTPVRWSVKLMTKATDGEQIGGDYGGQVTLDNATSKYKFEIPTLYEADNGRVFVITASVATDTSVESATLAALDSIRIVLTADTIRPEKPSLDPGSELLKYLNGVYEGYCTRSSLPFRLNGTSASSGSKETLHYSVNEASTGAGAETPTVASPAADPDNPSVAFFPEDGARHKPGGYAVAMIVIDEAGNTSEILTFENVVKVDDNEYSVYANARTGPAGLSVPVTGAAYGTFRFIKNGSNFGGVSSITARRGEEIGLVYTFKPQQFSQYHLGYVYNAKNFAAFLMDPEYGQVTIETGPSGTVYTFRFTMDGSYISDDETRIFTFEFKNKIYANVGGARQTFEAKEPTAGVPTEGVTRTVSVNYFYRKNGTQEIKIPDSFGGEYSVMYGRIAEDGSVDYGSVAFSAAGEYRYKIELLNNSEYYCLLEDAFVIEKASPGVSGFLVRGPRDEGGGTPSIEFGEAGGFGLFKLLSRDDNGAESDQRTSIGLRGRFEITNFHAGESAFDRPVVGAHTLTVLFYPEEPNSVNGVMNSLNYKASDPITAHVEVVKKDLNNAGEMVFFYNRDGSSGEPLAPETEIYYNERPLSVYLDPARLEAYGLGALDVEYLYSVSGGDFSPAAPTGAGNYNVRARIRDTVENYRGTLTVSVEIRKKTLDVFLRADQTNEFVYGYYAAPSARARDPETGVSPAVLFDFEYAAAGSTSFTGTVPQNAGAYVARISARDQNYEGTLDFAFTIRKARVGDAGLTINNPIPQPQADGSALRFGAPLKDMSTLSGSVSYEKADGSKIYVNGAFRPKSIGGEGSDYVPTAEEIRANNNYAFYFEFTPSGADAENFEVLDYQSNIGVSPAIPSFSGISIPSAAYGQTLGERIDAMLGKAEYLRYDPVSGAFVKEEIATGSYVYVGSEFSLTDVPAVGTWTLPFRYAASPEDVALYADTEFRLTITIERNAQELYVVGADGAEIDTFTKFYGLNATVPAENVRTRSGVTGLAFEYRYFRKNENGALSDEITDAAAAPAGRYYLEIAVGDRNYSGRTVVTFVVAPVAPGPGTNTAQYPEALNALEWGDSTFAFGAEQDMTGSVYRDDGAVDALGRVAGTFAFAEDRVFSEPSAGVSVRLRFTPDDGANYLPFEFDYTIPVHKRTVAFRYGAETVYNAETQFPEILLYDGDAAIPAEAGKYALSFPDGNPLRAGVYRGEARVADEVEKYRGSAEIVFTVLPETAVVEIERKAEGYPAGEPTVPQFTLKNAAGGALKGSTDGETTLRFFDCLGVLIGEAVFGGAAPENAPRFVGAYSVEITVSGNHKGTASARFDLVPVNVGVDTAVIVDYLKDAEQRPEITPIRDGYVYNARLEYREAGTSGAWTEERPRDAGYYEVRVALDENGYRNVYELGVKYTVNAIETAEILSDTPARFVYGVVAPELSFTAYGAGAESDRKLSYSLRYFRGTGEELPDAPAHAGAYRVSVSIEERNYFGQTEFAYVIETAAAPKNVGAIETAPVAYKTEFPSGTDAIFTGRGRFFLSTAADEAEVEGVFSVLTDEFSAFGVGVHGVTFEFRPTAAAIGGIRYEISEGDTERYRGVTEIAVVKRTLTAEDFSVVAPELVGGVAVAYYDETQKGVTIAAVGAVFSPKEAKDVAQNAVVTYKNTGIAGAVETTAKPLAAGSYEVKVTVKHDNYEGGFTCGMRIEKARPEFVAPSFVRRLSIDAENALSAGETVTSAEPLYACYAGTDGAPIAGTFTVKESVTFKKANLQPFRAVFTPDDADNVLSVETILYVYVEASETYAIDSALFLPIGIASYGSFADASALRLKSETGGVRFAEKDGLVRAFVRVGSGTEIYGDFLFKKTAALPDVGTSLLPVYFVPDPEDPVSSRYQITSFYATVTVAERAEVRVGGGAVYATVAPGEPYASAVFSAELTVVSPVSAGAEAVPPAAFRFASGFDPSAIVPSSPSALPGNVRAEYLGGKNFRSENPDYEVRFVFSVREAGILAERLSYEYHPNRALAISVENGVTGMGVANYMRLSFSGAGDVQPGYFVSVEAVGAPLVEDPGYGLLLYDVGAYRVTVTIDRDSGYYGEKTFVFEITPRDIGSYIRVNDQPAGTAIEKTYLDSLTFLAKAYSPSTGLPYDADYTYRFREKGGSDYTESVPVYAGEYVLRVEVDSSDRYRGAAEFDFVIRKKAISVSESALSYTYGNAPAEIVPRLEESVRWEFSFTDSDGNELYNRYPVNAGEYTGRVTVSDPNFEGSASFRYTVYPAQTSVTAFPEYRALRYGQTLREAAVSKNGSATAAVGGAPVEARGTFAFADPDAALSTGTHSVEVVFTPDNANYQTVTGTVRVTVERAEVTITIDRTDFSYDGTELDLSRIYTVYPSAGVVPTAAIRRGSETGELVSGIVGVGTYYVTFTVDTENYQAEARAVVRVAKGAADENQTEAPAASSLVYGQTLKNSVLSGGTVRYGGRAVPGSFRFLSGEIAPSEIGEAVYPVLFTPNDSVNYEPFGGYTVTIRIDKAPLEITVSDVSCVYGTAVTAPTFRVSAVGGEAFDFVLEPAFESWIGRVMPAASIATKVTLKSDYYYGEKEFTYTVLKKTVRVGFYKDAERTELAETLSSTYGGGFTPYPGIYPSDAVGADQTDGLDALNAKIVVEYRLPDGTIVKNAPKNAGDGYAVIATYVGENYNGVAEIRYTVNRARVAEISIDAASLNRQIYGSVSMPNVTTKPAGISFDTEFGSGRGLPTEAGSYNLTVVVTDPNYERTEKSFVFIVNPKKIGIENIVVSDKAFDGVASLTATGTLAGILIGDEVTLSMSAATAGGKTDPGEYAVEITSVKLGGRHAKNYTFDLPVYTKTVKIIANKVTDAASGSFIVFPERLLSDGVTVEFKNVASKQNKENFLSTLLGQKAQVVSFAVKVDGVKTDLSDTVRVYVKIPERFQNEKSFAVDGLGGLEGQIIWTRAGDYIWFDAARSGEIVFSVTNFPYGMVFAATGILILLIGIFALSMFEPIRKKRALMYKERGTDGADGGKKPKRNARNPRRKKSKKKPSGGDEFWSEF